MPLAMSTDGLSGADLAAVCSVAARSSIRRVVESASASELANGLANTPSPDSVLIRKSDILQALRRRATQSKAQPMNTNAAPTSDSTQSECEQTAFVLARIRAS